MAQEKQPNKKHRKKSKDQSIKGFKFSRMHLAVVALVFAAIGGFIILKTFAAPPDPPAVQVVINEPGYGPSGPKSITLNSGQATSIGWYSANASSCYWDPSWSGSPTNTGGSWQYQGTGSLNAGIYIYHLVCGNAAGSSEDSVTVNVNNAPQQPPVASISVSPNSGTAGSSATLQWASTNGASYCNGTWAPGQTLQPNDSITVHPTQTTTYTVQCANNYSSNPASVTWTLITPPPPPPPAPTAFINSKDPTIDKGASTTLTWGSSNASSCSASGAWSGSKGTSGSQGVSPGTSSTYVITCSGNGSASASTSVTVRGTPPPPAAPAAKLVASPSSVPYNGTTFLQWSSSNATSCSASGAWSGGKGTSGTQKVGPLTSTQTYTISCSGPGGTAKDSASVSVGKAPAGCPPNCPKPAAPPAPTTALAPPAPTSTSEETPTISDDLSSTEGDSTSQSKKHRNWLRDFLLGGLLGLLTGQAKGAK